MKAKGSESTFGGNEGYPDKPEFHYVYDTTVKNHDRIAKGDMIVVVNKKHLIGLGKIDHIEVRKNIPKTRFRCPECNTQEHYYRKNLEPHYKCRNKHLFDEPVREHLSVDQFIAHYGQSFHQIPESTSVSLLNDFYIKRNIYYSIQPANPDFLQEFREVTIHLNNGSATNLSLLKKWTIPYVPSVADTREQKSVRRPTRKGQQKFRSQLFDIYGIRCMLTGTEVSEAIEASHICTYREVNDHHPQNGLLLRRDLHALFDANPIGIEPENMKVRLSSRLKDTAYRKFEGRELKTSRNDFRPSKKALKVVWESFLV